MRISCSLGSLLSVRQVFECSKILSRSTAEMIWIPETWGMENFSMLGAVSGMSGNCKLGSSIINIYSRSPAAIAMGAATVDSISGGRFVLGLGTSSMPIVETFHGYRFERPIQRMKEYVDIIRLVLSGNKINYEGKIFRLKNFSLLIKPERGTIPIYLAAINEKMVNLTWDAADGVIFYLRPKNEMKKTISKMQEKRDIDVACQIITCVSNDLEKATDRAKKTLSFYIAVGKIYREFLAANGYKRETENIFQEYSTSGLKSIHELVSDSMLESLCIVGTPEQCRVQLNGFRDSGINLPIVQFNPVGDTMESFELFKTALFDG